MNVFSICDRMVGYWWQGPYDKDKVVFNNVFTYLRCTYGNAKLAKLPVVVVGGGGAVHGELLHALAPSLYKIFDMIVIPNGDKVTLRDLMSFICSGR